ncbi:MAG TPA: response regulator, partial [Pyrinomonadaceae bacterium]
SKDFLPFVFDRFRQADSTTTRQHGGLGLGLAIARHLVEIHGGSIHAESDGQGTGSTFIVRLPLIGSLPKTQAQAQPTGNGKKMLDSERALVGLRVLLVDDDQDTLDLLTAALTQCEAQVTAVSSATEAIDALKLQQPDVLISDIAMPGRDGYELIREIRSSKLEAERSVPAVAITAYAKDEDRRKALAAGYQQYVAKPVEFSELISAITKVAKRT